ncbi:MAG: prephenate dehydrogenase [Eubacteriales bacterium]|nr:prephenate dehydrogenase [Eubacteriales bacterium]
MVVTVVGLGLIGGSMVRRLRGFMDAKIYGVDIDTETLRLAESDGVIDKGYIDGKSIVGESDLIILCLYPEKNVEFVRENAHLLKKDAVLTDVSGVKGYVLKGIEGYLPDGVEFIGGHPMAGRETGGYKSSTDTLFDGASYLITPAKDNSARAVSLVRSMAEYIGCRHVVTTSPEEHDAMIAYTSQLMHVVAVALCDNPLLERSASFSAGSLRDCTRVALINADMWSELFLENKDALCDRIDEFKESLDAIKLATKTGDREGLKNILARASERKQKWLSETVK